MASEAPRQSNTTVFLVREIGKGNFDRFTELYERVAPALRAWASLRLPSSALQLVAPEDILQEVWMRAIRKIGDYDETGGPFRP